MSSWELNKMVVMHFIWLEFHQSATVSLHKVTHFSHCVCVCVCVYVCVCVCVCPSGRPLPPTPSSSLLPPAPPPPSAPLHQAATSIRECQMPLLDSGSSHAILDPPPDDEFSPNSYLFRAQPPVTGKSVSLHCRILHHNQHPAVTALSPSLHRHSTVLHMNAVPLP